MSDQKPDPVREQAIRLADMYRLDVAIIRDQKSGARFALTPRIEREDGIPEGYVVEEWVKPEART